MSAKPTNLRPGQPTLLVMWPLLFLFFFLVACKEQPVVCTYEVVFDPGSTDAQKEQSAGEFEASVEKSTSAVEKGTDCNGTTTWDKSDPNKWTAQVTIDCFKASDSGYVRPPSVTKPPAGRVTNGTVTKVRCSDE